MAGQSPSKTSQTLNGYAVNYSATSSPISNGHNTKTSSQTSSEKPTSYTANGTGNGHHRFDNSQPSGSESTKSRTSLDATWDAPNGSSTIGLTNDLGKSSSHLNFRSVMVLLDLENLSPIDEAMVSQIAGPMFLYGLSTADIATELSISEGFVRGYLDRWLRDVVRQRARGTK